MTAIKLIEKIQMLVEGKEQEVRLAASSCCSCVSNSPIRSVTVDEDGDIILADEE